MILNTVFLEEPLDDSKVMTRSERGVNLRYMEGWQYINAANLAFGFDGWSYECQVKLLNENKIDNRHSISYWAHVTVMIDEKSIVRQDIGCGHGISPNLGKAHESALKEAVTDGLKRALRSFGNQFGNSLYGKSGPTWSTGTTVTQGTPTGGALSALTQNSGTVLESLRSGAERSEPQFFTPNHPDVIKIKTWLKSLEPSVKAATLTAFSEKFHIPEPISPAKLTTKEHIDWFLALSGESK